MSTTITKTVTIDAMTDRRIRAYATVRKCPYDLALARLIYLGANAALEINDDSFAAAYRFQFSRTP